MFGLDEKELALLRTLTTPALIQDFLDKLAINHEKRGETCMSPRLVLRERKAHCLEGALVAAVALWLNNESPLLLELRAADHDQDHAVTLYKRGGLWGAISKTNHAALRFRDPIFRTPRELAASYFHEYFLNDTGEKTLQSYTRPFSLKKFGTRWITSEEPLWKIAYALQDAPSFPLVPRSNKRFVRSADHMEKRAGRLVEWKKTHPRT